MKKCNGPCGEWKPVREFTWGRRVLADGTERFYPHTRCLKCEAERQKAIRAARGPKRKRKSKRKPVTRVPKQPFLDFVAEKRALKDGIFIIDHGGDGSHDPNDSSILKWQFDTKRFAAYLGLTKTQFDSLMRISRAGHEQMTVDFGLVDQVLTHVGEEHRLHELYPDL
jgi:hypothetical protein